MRKSAQIAGQSAFRRLVLPMRIAIDDLPMVSASRMRAAGEITADMKAATVRFGDEGVEFNVALWVMRFRNGGSWSYFICGCGRKCRTLRLYEGELGCKGCLEAKGLRYWIEDLSKSERAAYRAPRLKARLMNEVPARLKPHLRWGTLERRSRLEAALRQAELGWGIVTLLSLSRATGIDVGMMFRAKIPDSCADLCPAKVERMLEKHFGDIYAAARELGVPGPDLRRLTWAQPSLHKNALEELELVVQRAMGEGLGRFTAPRPVAANGRRQNPVELLARDHPLAPARRGMSASVNVCARSAFAGRIRTALAANQRRSCLSAMGRPLQFRSMATAAAIGLASWPTSPVPAEPPTPEPPPLPIWRGPYPPPPLVAHLYAWASPQPAVREFSP